MSFEDRLKDMQETHDRKGRDYGTKKDPYANIRASEGFGVPAWLGAIIRLNDKIARIKAFREKGELANESLEDSLRDIATYGAIAWDLYLEEQHKDPAPAPASRNPTTDFSWRRGSGWRNDG